MDSYSKSYKNDIYFFVPMTSVNSDETFSMLHKAEKEFTEKYQNGSDEARAIFELSKLYKDTLNEHVLYECNSEIFRTLTRVCLGKFSLACYDDDYDGTVIDTEDTYIYVSAHKRTGLYIVTLAIYNNNYIPTQLIDQMSTYHLDVYDENTNEYVNIIKYMEKHFSLSLCGEAKCVACLSNYPKDRTELGYLLSGETYVSEHITYHIRPERIDAMLKNRACYDYYDSYISRSVVVFIFTEWPEEDFETRLSSEVSVLFVVEIVMFQNTAVLRTSNRVIEELDENDDITLEEVEELYVEFGKTMPFWKSDIFKYPFSQKEADEVIDAFKISKTLDEYHRNQRFLDRLIEVKSILADQKSDSIMNTILYIISCIDGGSITLGGIMWLLKHMMNESSPGYAIVESITQFSWVVAFVGLCILVMMFITGKLALPKKKKEKKAKLKKLRKEANDLVNPKE